jgi:hypothetical protein
MSWLKGWLPRLAVAQSAHILPVASTCGAADATVVTRAFSDSFNGARDADPTYGLNDNLAVRQTGKQQDVTYPGLMSFSTPVTQLPKNIDAHEHIAASLLSR